jgi:hypothetical protein
VAGVGLPIVVAAPVVLVLTLRQPGFSDTKELDVNQAQFGVHQILTDPVNGYGRNKVSRVSCNNGRNPIVEKGRGFTCEVQIKGITRRVSVVFRDDNGTYEVGLPR